jgi:hypothetical protein
VLIIVMESPSHKRQENPSMHAWAKNLVSGLGNERCNPLFARHICSQYVPKDVPNANSSNNGSFKPSVHTLANEEKHE